MRSRVALLRFDVAASVDAAWPHSHHEASRAPPKSHTCIGRTVSRIGRYNAIVALWRVLQREHPVGVSGSGSDQTVVGLPEQSYAHARNWRSARIDGFPLQLRESERPVVNLVSILISHVRAQIRTTRRKCQDRSDQRILRHAEHDLTIRQWREEMKWAKSLIIVLNRTVMYGIAVSWT